MTAVEPAPPMRLDRYLALLAILLALVLGLLVIGERQQSAQPLPAVEGALPPAASDAPVSSLAVVSGAAVSGAGGSDADREALLAEQARLAARLEETEAALRRAEAEIERLREENRALSERLEGEGVALDELARRLAAVEAERDRLEAEVAALTASRVQLAIELAERPAGAPLPSVTAPAPASPPDTAEAVPSELPPYRDPSAALAAQPRGLQAALEEVIREQRDAGESPVPGEAVAAPEAAVEPSTTALPAGEPSQLITFNGAGGTVAEGVQAYRAGDYAAAERIWGALAVSGDSRAQFHFGALMFEGRTAAPDLVMAYVWLSRAVDGGHLPAIDLRRQVRAAMSEAQYQEALAIQAGS